MTDRKSQTPISRLIYFFFLLSGATGLIYQVIWARLLGLSFGSNIYAISLVLATFMAGLSVGGYWVGRYLDRHIHPLKLYALLELGIGFWALLAPFLLTGVDNLYVKLFPSLGSSLFFSSLLRFGLSSIVLFVPTLLMGGTLPALTTYFTKHLKQVGGKLSFLYAINTLGAVIGTWFVGFYALPWLGINLTNILAALTNLVIGVLCLLFDYGTDKQPVANITESQPIAEYDWKLSYFILVGIFLAGFSAMVYEIAWTRCLIMVLGSSTYAFSCILIAFLLGISLGSFIYSRRKVKKTPGLIGFCLIEILIGVFCLLSLPAFSLLPHTYLMFYNIFAGNGWAVQWLRFLLPLIIMIVPATLMGAAFPIAGEIYAQSRRRVSSSVGNIYGSNTLGNVLGALSAGFFLLSSLGVQNTIKLAIILNLSIGLAGVLIKKTKHTLILTGVVFLFAGLTLFQPPWDKYLVDSGASIRPKTIKFHDMFNIQRDAEMLYYKEGLNCIVSVYQYPDANRSLKVNGKADASTNKRDMPTQLLLGYLPVFLHPDPQQALVIGLGSGITSRTVAQYDFITQVDTIEIEPAVVEAAKYFNDFNHNIHQNPKVKIIEEDGRGYLRVSNKFYDLIISEPSNPWIKGIGNLFSVDFYNLCRQKLKPDGVMCQWIHFYNMSPEVVKMVINSFRQTFNYCQLWFLPQGNDAIIIGSQTPIVIDLEHASRLINYNDTVKFELKRYMHIESAEDLIAYFLLNNAELAEFTRGGKLNTDNYPRLEFLAPRSQLLKQSKKIYKELIGYKKNVLFLNQKPTDAKISVTNYYYKLSQIYLMANLIRDANYYINKALKRDSQDARFYIVRGDINTLINNYQQAIDDFKQSSALDSNNFEPHLKLAHIYQNQENWSEATSHFQQALALAPQNEKLRFHYANFLFSQAKYEQALTLVQSLTDSHNLKDFLLWELIGDLYFALGEINKAKEFYDGSLKKNPANVNATVKLARLDYHQGKIGRALKRLNPIKYIKTNSFTVKRIIDLLQRISDHYIKFKNYDNATAVLQEILQYNPDNVEAYNKLKSLPRN
jgi:spermidine synthase